MSPRVPADESRDEAIEFVLAVGRTLHVCGASAAEVEHAMTTCARKFGIHGEYFATPTSIFASFREAPDVTRSSSTHLMRVEPGSADLGRRERVDNVLDDVLHDRLDAREGRVVLAAILTDPPMYSGALMWLCSGLSSAAAARFFGLDAFEIALAGAVGLTIGLFERWGRRSSRLRRVFLLTAAFGSAALVSVACGLRGQATSFQVVIASLIMYLPGLRLTTSMIELALDHLAAGTARLLGAVMSLITLLFGAALGAQLGRLFETTMDVASLDASRASVPGWTFYAAMVVAPLCFGVLFRALPRDLPWIVASCSLAVFGSRLGAHFLGTGFEAALGGLFVGLASNVYARALDRPAVTTMLPGILLLVPGSLGFRSLFSLLERDVLTGVEAAFQVATVGMSIVGGLFVANVLIRPRKIDRVGA